MQKKNLMLAYEENYDADDFSQGGRLTMEAFRALTKGDMLQPYISDHDFRSFSEGNDVGYNLLIIDKRDQKKITAFQSIKVEFKFDGVVPSNIIAYDLVSTNTVLNVSSDGQKHFNLI